MKWIGKALKVEGRNDSAARRLNRFRRFNDFMV